MSTVKGFCQVPCDASPAHTEEIRNVLKRDSSARLLFRPVGEQVNLLSLRRGPVEIAVLRTECKRGVPPQFIECDRWSSQTKQKKKILTFIAALWLISSRFRSSGTRSRQEFRGSIERGS